MHNFDIYTKKINLPREIRKKLFSIENYMTFFNSSMRLNKNIFDSLEKEDDVLAIKDIFIPEEKIIDKNKVSHHTDLELKGYIEVKKYIFYNYKNIELNIPNILLFHTLMYKYVNYPLAGKFRTQEIKIYHSIKDKGLKDSGLTFPYPNEVKNYIDQLLNSYKEGIKTRINYPIILDILFIFDFLVIHPFSDGNGRMSRLLFILLLLKTNIALPKFIPFEKLRFSKIFLSSYKSQKGWDTNENDVFYIIDTSLKYLNNCCKELYNRIYKKLNIDTNRLMHKIDYSHINVDNENQIVKEAIQELNKSLDNFNKAKKDKLLIEHLKSYDDLNVIHDIFIKKDTKGDENKAQSHHSKEENDLFIKASNYILNNYKDIDINEENIKKIHLMVYPGDDKYRTGIMTMRKEGNKDNKKNIISVKLNPKYINEAMTDLVSNYNKAIKNKSNIFLTLALFTLDFIYIHPFKDANGRTARLLELLILLKNDIDFVLYAPIKKYNRMRLYANIEASSINWEEGINNPIYYKVEFLNYLIDNAKIVEERINKYKNTNKMD